MQTWMPSTARKQTYQIDLASIEDRIAFVSRTWGVLMSVVSVMNVLTTVATCLRNAIVPVSRFSKKLRPEWQDLA